MPTTKPTPRHIDSFVALAERRAWLDSLPDARVRISTTPTEKRLRAANDNQQIRTLDALDALLAPHAPVAANANDPDTALPTSAAQPGRGWRMRPTIGEMELASVGRVAVRSARGRTHAARSRGGTIHIGDLVFTKQATTERAPILVLGEAVMGDVHVPAGAMIGRGISKNGKVLKPAEYRTYEKSAGKPRRGKGAIRDYLKLGGTPWPVQFLDGDFAPGFVCRGREKQGAAALLEQLGLDGSVPFDAARSNAGLPPSGKGDDGYWWDGDWFGGVSRCHGGGTPSDGNARRANNEALRMIVQSWLRRELSRGDMDLLEFAISGATATEAGDALGMTRQRYVQAANDAVDRVSAILNAA